MRLPVSRIRAAVEALLRTLVIGLLGWSLLATMRQNSAGGPEERVSSSGLDSALIRWSTASSPSAIEASLAYPPSAAEREWLAALPGAGSRVAWQGPDLVPTAVSLLPVADPAGGFDLAVASPTGTSVVMGDSLGRQDTVAGMAGGIRMYLPGSNSMTGVQIGPISSRAVARDSLHRGRILVLGAAGWEGKFVAAALEERGWVVDLHFGLSPKGDVAQGLTAGAGVGSTPSASPTPAGPPPASIPSGLRMRSGVFSPQALLTPETRVAVSQAAVRIPIDTSRYSVVIALDSTAAREALRISRFVRNGGGLVLWPGAAESPELRALAAGKPADPTREIGRRIARPVQPESLALRPMVDLAPDALVLERSGSYITLAGRRIGVGRVVQTANVEFWRIRLAGDEGSIDRHRTWLARVVAGVAFTRRLPLPNLAGDGAPLAALIGQLGPPATGTTLSSVLTHQPLAPWVLIVASAALLLEWLSRRLRSRP